MTDTDDFDLERFVEAQDSDATFDRALAELVAGRKQTHWMWFVFPQLAGLSQSPTGRYYAISGIEEARAYLGHPILGERLRRCAAALVELRSHDPERVFGGIDAVKLRSSMTLFELADPTEPLFAAVIDQYFSGDRDPMTTGSAAGGGSS